eukprot:GHVR01083733.1.p1 GENE.GHVR01083733.1~~GHVR01083733.1.p1  ORF type:complete len:523 (-),score=84.91 GHVR01083733.1:612-2180(-)
MENISNDKKDSILSKLYNTRGVIDMEELRELSLDDGLIVIHDERVLPLLNYLNTDVFTNKNNISFMNAYTIVVHFGDQHGHSCNLYNYYVKVVDVYCKGLLPFLIKLKGNELLSAIADKWEKVTILIYWMQRVFQYLDRFYTKLKKDPELFQRGLMCFTEHVYNHIKTPLLLSFMDAIKTHRETGTANTHTLEKVVEMYRTVGDSNVKITKIKSVDNSERLVWSNANLGVYKTDFEKVFLEATDVYYQRKSDQWLKELNCRAYLKETSSSLEDEERRLVTYLDLSTRKDLEDVLHKQLIYTNANKIINMESGVKSMLEQGKRGDLRLMFDIFRLQKSTLHHIATALKPYVSKRVVDVVSTKNCQDKPEQFIHDILEVKLDLDSLMSNCFPGESLFEKTRNLVLEEELNKDTVVAKCLALYCNVKLTKDLKGASDEDVSAWVNRVVGLLVHLRDKDVFIDVYRERLSKRLLNRLSVSNDFEEQLINRIKMEVGKQPVQKICSMFVDITLSDSLHDEFFNLSHK